MKKVSTRAVEQGTMGNTMVYEIGQKVEALTRYRGQGEYSADGHEGTWYVCADMGTDLELARTEEEARDEKKWGVHVSKQRIQGDPAASWRKDFGGKEASV